jgi:hypothetical protein
MTCESGVLLFEFYAIQTSLCLPALVVQFPGIDIDHCDLMAWDVNLFYTQYCIQSSLAGHKWDMAIWFLR